MKGKSFNFKWIHFESIPEIQKFNNNNLSLKFINSFLWMLRNFFSSERILNSSMNIDLWIVFMAFL
jgi:hypothetical protein